MYQAWHHQFPNRDFRERIIEDFEFIIDRRALGD